jgi:hypothetical protein
MRGGIEMTEGHPGLRLVDLTSLSDPTGSRRPGRVPTIGNAPQVIDLGLQAAAG